MEVLGTPTLVHGPRSEEFEKLFAAYTGAPYAVALSSCTAALHLAYFHLGIGAGDEVIVPAQTHVATAHAVELCGGKPVFVDAEAQTGNIDIDQIEQKITPKTRALSVVHFLGMPVEMDRVVQIAKKHGLFVVEDCALAVGSFFKGAHAGLCGDLGCFSFYPVKHITTAEGGMAISRDEKLVKALRLKKAFGVDRSVAERTIPGVYDVTALGFNYRMSELQAAIGIEQVKQIPSFIAKRKTNYEFLAKGLEEIDEISLLRSTHGDFQSSYYCLSILLKETLAPLRPEIIRFLKKRGVGTSVYYPQPVPLFSYYQTKYHAQEKDFPVATRISRTSIALPVGPHLALEDMDYIVDRIKEAFVHVKAGV